MQITRKDLKDYPKIEKIIQMNEKKLQKYIDNPPVRIHGKVRGSNPMFPYEQRNFTIGTGESDSKDEVAYNQKCRYLEVLIASDTRRFKKLQLAIDELIAGISDPAEKLVLEYTSRGKSQEWIGRQLSMDQSNVSRIIKKYVSL